MYGGDSATRRRTVDSSLDCRPNRFRVGWAADPANADVAASEEVGSATAPATRAVARTICAGRRRRLGQFGRAAATRCGQQHQPADDLGRRGTVSGEEQAVGSRHGSCGCRCSALTVSSPEPPSCPRVRGSDAGVDAGTTRELTRRMGPSCLPSEDDEIERGDVPADLVDTGADLDVRAQPMGCRHTLRRLFMCPWALLSLDGLLDGRPATSSSSRVPVGGGGGGPGVGPMLRRSMYEEALPLVGLRALPARTQGRPARSSVP